MKLTQVAILVSVAALACADLISINGKDSDPCVSPLWTTPYPLTDCNEVRPPSNEILYFPSSPQNTAQIPIVVLFPALTSILQTSATPLAFGTAALGQQCATGVIDHQVVINVAAVNPTAALGTMASVADAIGMEFEPAPRKLCFQAQGATNWIWTGLYFAYVYGTTSGNGCLTNSDCTSHPALATPPTGIYFGTNPITGLPLVTPAEQLLLATQSVCCPGAAGSGRPGICVNANVQSCCGGVAIENSVEQCCNTLSEATRYLDAPCPCQKTSSGPIGCPSGEFCCLPQKYQEYNQTVSVTINGFYGECYNPATERCCNTGEIYDPGSLQCCSINGLQTLDVACPCGVDLDCAGGQYDATGGTAQQFTTMRCCLQTQPPLSSTDYYCNAYSNFPGLFDISGAPITAGDPTLSTSFLPYPEFFRPGQSDYLLNTCPGVCVDTSFQICCNGNPCYGTYQTCCNATCCNKYNEGCLEALFDVRNAFVAREFMIKYQGCTTIETLTSERAFWVFVVPIFLLVATLAAFAIVVVFANTITSRSYSFVERLWVGFAIVGILFALPTYFSPIYKYGVVTVVVALLSILSAAARVRWLNILAVGATIVLLVYLFDPFHGNNYWNLASLRLPNGNPWPWASGVINSIRGFWGQDTNDYCTWFYHGYFRIDAALQDQSRWDNPEVINFGYCDRGWATALLVFEGFQLLVGLWLFALALLALILRFRKIGVTPVELDARPVIIDY